jgi:dipeptidyl-peptidase 4
MTSALLLAFGTATGLQAPSLFTEADYQRALTIERRYQGKEARTRVSPNWFEGGLWYRVEAGGGQSEWVAAKSDGTVKRFKTQKELFDEIKDKATVQAVLRLSDRLIPAETGERVILEFHNTTSGVIEIFWVSGGEKVSYGKIEAGSRFAQGTFAGHGWEVRNAEGKVLGYMTTPAAGGTVTVDGAPPERARPRRQDLDRNATPPSPRWEVFARDHNVWVRPRSGGQEVQLSRSGKAESTFNGTRIIYSPDGKKAVAFQTDPVVERKIHIVSSSPKDQVQPKLITLDYAKPGDPMDHSFPVLFDLESKAEMPVDRTLIPHPWSLPPLGDSGWGHGVTWAKDSSRFFFAYNPRGHRKMEVWSVDAATGQAKLLIRDDSPGFIHYSGKFWAALLENDDILWMSERDGWNHLYIHDAKTGAQKRPLTQGQWVVKGVEDFDEAKGRLILKVGGRNPGEDPYHAHFVSVSIKTGRITPLTEGDGTHRLSFSPDGSHYLDTYSRVDLPPVTELRRTSDGKRLALLEEGSAKALLETGWQPPQRHVAKGRDGKTDIWGALWKPTHFDPKKKYPVIEQIYAGPHGHHVPKQWAATYGGPQQLAELGFLVVQIDGMGTDGRGRDFHQVAFKNLRDAGFPDRIAWMKSLAKEVPAMDLTRVGIYGGSAGGQNAMAALLWHGDFYKAAAADCGCHDNRMDKIWWNEQWMSWPVDKSYEDSSNVVHAGRLTGALLLTVGELDTNVDPASTMQVADALIRANKDFELIVFPGGGHGAGDSPYGKLRRMKFFVRHLSPTPGPKSGGGE